MSLRMAVAVRLARLFLRPLLARMKLPEAGQRFGEGIARFLQRPPAGLRHLVRQAGALELHWIGVGPSVPRRVILYFHGGAFVLASPHTHAAMLGRLSQLSGVEVCAPRYPLAQEAPFPAAPEAALAAWEALMGLGYRPGDVVVAGDSAGGTLAAGLLAQLLARGERPAGLLLFSPWADLTLSGESLRRFAHSDPILPIERADEILGVYLAGADPHDPRASPLFADYPGAPPVLIQVGAEEALLSDAERLAERLRDGGGEVTLDLWPGCPHVWQLGDGWLPEARAALRKAARFVQDSFARVSR